MLHNKSIIKNRETSNSLFEQFEQTMFLIPEVKKADFVLKIETDDASIEPQTIVKKISSINAVTMSYIIDKNTIKTKSNLIF